MDNKIDVLNGLLNELDAELRVVNERIERLSIKNKDIRQELEELHSYVYKLGTRRTALKEIIDDEKLKSSSIKINDDDGVIVGMDMSNGPDMTVLQKNKDLISSPNSHNLYAELINSGEMHIIKSNIAREASKEIEKRMERDHKHGKV